MSSSAQPPTQPSSSSAESTPPPSCWKPFLLKHFLPLGLVCALLIGLVIPGFGQALAALKAGEWSLVQSLCMVFIFVISGLTLKTDDIRAAIRAWKATTFGVTSILFITPTLALLPGQLPFLVKEFQVGFLLFCCMPTTINSGVALAQSAKGSFALALLLTVLSNLIGIFTAPFFLSLLLSVADVHVSPQPLLLKLLLMILLPLIIGKAAREKSAPVLAAVKKHKTYLSNTSNLSLITIVLMSISKSQPKIVSLDVLSLLGLVMVGLLIHAIYLAFNFSVAHYLLKLPLPLKKSVVVMCSQKTLPMAMTIVAFLPEEVGEPGLVSIPCIVSHLVQIFADAFLCSKWAQYTDTDQVSLSSSDGAAARPSIASSTKTAATAAAPPEVSTPTVEIRVTSGEGADPASAEKV